MNIFKEECMKIKSEKILHFINYSFIFNFSSFFFTLCQSSCIAYLIKSY